MAYLRFLLVVVMCCGSVSAAESSQRPNIVWLSCEDISPHLGCYGYSNAVTPHLDAFAERSVVYEHAYTTAGVCAPCRSAIITGMYQTSYGGHHMRCNATLPKHIRPFTMWLREAGYYCTNNSKQDYQFRTPKGTWDESGGKAHWKNRDQKEQPFFSVFNYTGCHESGIASDAKYQTVTRGQKPQDRSVTAASLPPYYPSTPAVLDDWGRYYDVITAMDRWFGRKVSELEEAGLADSTIVIFWSDHGVGLPRAKRWLYESGTHVPLIVHVPAVFQKSAGVPPMGSRTDRLVSTIDLGPSVLSLAGLPVPEHMHGQAFLGATQPQARRYIFGARDRMDERYDIIRSVRSDRYRYIRNYEPYKTWYQYMNTPEKGRTMQAIRQISEDPGADVSAGVAQFLLPEKPLEELYDVRADPHEMRNLAGDPGYAGVLNELRDQHLQWVAETRDLGLIPEAELTRRTGMLGSDWAALNTGPNADSRMQRLRDAAVLAGGNGADDLGALEEYLADEDAAVRYWAATGIGNRLRSGILTQVASGTTERLTDLTEDPSENVRVAAARALVYAGASDKNAVEVIARVLDDGTQWGRLHAANVLDELDETARPVIAAMRRNKAYRQGMVAEGKYTVRVLNKALNDLDGTSLTVP